MSPRVAQSHDDQGDLLGIMNICSTLDVIQWLSRILSPCRKSDICSKSCSCPNTRTFSEHSEDPKIIEGCKHVKLNLGKCA